MASSRTARLLRADRHVGMGRPEALLENCERTTIERLGLGNAVRDSEQLREIVEANRHRGIVRTIVLFPDCERAALERFGLGVARLGVEQNSEVVEQLRRRLGNLRRRPRCARPRARAARADREQANFVRRPALRRTPRSPIPALHAKPAADARRSSRGGRNPARGDERRSPARRRPSRSRPKRANRRRGRRALHRRRCPAPRREQRRRGANPEPGRGRGRRAGRAAPGSPARAARPMSPTSWPASDQNLSPSHPPKQALSLGSRPKASDNGRSRCDRSRYARRPAQARAQGRQAHAPASSLAPYHPCSCFGQRPSGRAGIARPRSRRAWKLGAFAPRRENSTPAR